MKAGVRFLASTLLLLALAIGACQSPEKKKKTTKQETKPAKVKPGQESTDVDFDGFVSRLRKAVAAPPLSYLLGFSPQNLKIDGRYHTLKVALTNKQKFNIQARHGYYAPRTIKDPAEAAKEEIQEALFSQDEIHDLPVEVQTQFFKKDPAQARLAVLTHVDVKGIRFRKAEGRNRDDLTVATAIFDENGNFVTGGEKIVEMRLLDRTFERLSHSGFIVKSSFDIKPGTYLVRLVVRDAEGAQMAARNGAVNIPF